MQRSSGPFFRPFSAGRKENFMICNEYRKTGLARQNTIEFRFVAPPSSIRISLGDVDPMTGNSLEDAGLFRLYYVLQNSQAYYNNKARKAPFSQKEKGERAVLRQEIAETFIRDHGYAPGGETLFFLLEERWPTPYTVSFEAMTADDMAVFEKDPRFADPTADKAFPGQESDDTEALREFAKSLSGRLLDVYETMLAKVDAGAEQPEWIELARKWGVCPGQITKDQKKIVGMIREYSGRVRRFSYDRG